jgi:hypothetical protein
VTRFFQLVTTRQFAEAERVLERIKQKITMSDKNRGYYQALYGMLLTQRNGDDRYAFLTNFNAADKKELNNSRREFHRQSEYRLHADYDRGFFSAWADYMRILSKIETTAAPVVNNKGHEEDSVEPVEQPAEVPEKTETLEEAKPEQSTLTDFSE